MTDENTQIDRVLEWMGFYQEANRKIIIDNAFSTFT